MTNEFFESSHNDTAQKSSPRLPSERELGLQLNELNSAYYEKIKHMDGGVSLLGLHSGRSSNNNRNDGADAGHATGTGLQPQ